MIVTANIAQVAFTYCVAHAPHSGATSQQRERWWQELHHELGKAHPGRQLVIFIDANTQVPHVTPYTGKVDAMEDDNATHLLECMQRFALFAPSTFEQYHQGDSTTWQSNDARHAKRIDYILVPQIWSTLKLSSYVEPNIHAGAGGIDHTAVCLEVGALFGRHVPATQRPRYDRQKIQQATEKQWRAFYNSWPHVSWTTDPTTHAHLLEQEICKRLEEHFPEEKRKRRQSLQFSDSTWLIFKHRNHIRKALKAHPQAMTALLLTKAVQKWRQIYGIGGTARELIYALRIANLWQQYKAIQTALHKAIREDRARHLTQMQESLTRANRADVLKLLKHFRLGKRNRDLGKRPLPMVELENGSLATTPEEAKNRWRRHFASMEGGTVMDPADLLHPKHHQPRHMDPQLSELPSLFELERQMRSTTPGKAMGFDMVPPELLHGSSQRLAYIAWPLFLKQNLTGIECLQHKGGRLVSAFKRRGSLQRCENHRALLVSSSLGKAFHSTFRRRTVPYVQAIAGRMQITSHATPSVAMAAHVVRAHLHGAKQRGLSAFALCLDITHAFYRVLRQLALDATCSDEHILAFLKRMGIEEYCISDLEAMMEQESALEQAQCPKFLHHTVAEYHRHTWFVLHQDDRLVCTEKGTRPGDGFADILWSLIFSKWIAKLEARLVGSGDFQPLPWNGLSGLFSEAGTESIPRSLIAWADDVVILGMDVDGQHLIDKLQFTCSAMVQELVQFGLQPNFKAGKTEAIVDIRGKGSTALRRTLFQDLKGQLSLDTPMPEQPTLRLVASYKHLGGLLTHGSKLLPEVKHRIGQGCTAFHNYRTKIYKNKNIDVDTRMTVFRATTLAAMHYNAATWSGYNQKTLNTWRTGHLNLYRRALSGLFPYQELLHYTDDEILTIVDENAPDETIALLLCL